jgi:galactokinase
VAGVTHSLRQAGHELCGFDARIRSEVPLGSGLSSSASLLVALTRGLRTLCNLQLDDAAIAKIAWTAEHDFVGAPVGVMDQMAASLADEKTALFIDTRTLMSRRVELPVGGEILVIDSGVRHQNATGDYRTRRAECEAAARELGVDLLVHSDLDSIDRLSNVVLKKRARHVVTENARVWACVEALERGDHNAVGHLFDESHVSLRDDFAVTVPAVDALVESARERTGVYGARMTGGGFGGAIVCWVEKGRAVEAGKLAMEAHAGRGFHGARVLIPAGE